MSKVLRAISLFVALLLGAAAGAAPASRNAPEQVSSGVKYEFLARWDVHRLNQILETDTPKFAGVRVAYTPARNAVKLYRVTYPSVIPEKGNAPTVASGLLAIPDTKETTFPLVSYQHGTVYGRQRGPVLRRAVARDAADDRAIRRAGLCDDRRRLFRPRRLAGARGLYGEGQPSAGLL